MLTHTPRSAAAIAADRARYDAHQRKGLEAAPFALPGLSPAQAPDPDPACVLDKRTIPGGWYDVLHLGAGEVLRLEIQGPGASISLAAWSATDTTERMNLPDTVKVQWTTDLRRGRIVLSDMGRVLFSIIEDSSGGHDVLTGGSPAQAPFTPARRNTRENMVLAAAKLGLDKRDLPALVTFFAPVRVATDGQLHWNAALTSGRDWVDLRAEMDLLLALSNTRHPLDPGPEGEEAPVHVTRLAGVAVPPDDPCSTATAEAVRAFQNTSRV